MAPRRGAVPIRVMPLPFASCSFEARVDLLFVRGAVQQTSAVPGHATIKRRARMISTRLRYLAFLCALLVTSPAFAEEVGVRNYQLPQHGVFRLQVPKSWQDRVSQPQGSIPPTIILTAGSGDAFQ